VHLATLDAVRLLGEPVVNALDVDVPLRLPVSSGMYWMSWSWSPSLSATCSTISST